MVDSVLINLVRASPFLHYCVQGQVVGFMRRGASDQDIVVGIANETVRAKPADQEVATSAADQQIVPIAAKQHIVRAAPFEAVVALAAEQPGRMADAPG